MARRRRLGPVKTVMIGVLGLVIPLTIMQLIGPEDEPAAPSTPSPRHPSSGPAHFVLSQVIVYKSLDAYERGSTLIRNGVHKSQPEAVAPYVSCLADGGNAVTVLGIAMFKREVLVNDGKEKGCIGWTAMENVVP